MTREEAKRILYVYRAVNLVDASHREAFDMAIKALEQDIVPFDFELYQAGLMDMPKEMIEVLDKIRDEIDEQYDRVHPYNISCAEGLEMALEIIDKYKAESEDKDGNK